MADRLDQATLPLPARAWRAWRAGGTSYLTHKVLRRALGRWPGWKRRLVYADPRSYWTLRGGADYFREQEDHPSRGDRAAWLAERIARYQPVSILEVGCGYGKQLRALRTVLPEIPLVGVDFSPTQLDQGRRYLADCSGVSLALASGWRLPFADASFDMVLTSAVILHNPPEQAEAIRREVVRVSRRFAAHNEDTNLSYNRYGYDTAAWYEILKIPVAESGPIDLEHDPDRAISQFCVADTCLRRT